MGRSFLSIKLAVIFGLLVGAGVLALEARLERRTPPAAQVEVQVRSAAAAPVVRTAPVLRTAL